MTSNAGCICKKSLIFSSGHTFRKIHYIEDVGGTAVVGSTQRPERSEHATNCCGPWLTFKMVETPQPPCLTGEEKNPTWHQQQLPGYQLLGMGSDLRLGCVNPAALLPVAFVARETIATFVMLRVTVLHWDGPARRSWNGKWIQQKHLLETWKSHKAEDLAGLNQSNLGLLWKLFKEHLGCKD